MLKSSYTSREIRLWAVILAGVLTAVAAVQYFVWGHERAAAVFWVLAVIFLVNGLLFPRLLKPVYYLWMKLAAALAWFNTRLILGIVFFLIFTPIGLILRLLRVDLIKQRWDEKAKSYWIKRPEEPFDPSNYEKQY